MSIRGAIALAITIVILKFLMWDVFGAFENTLIRSFGLADTVINKAQNTAAVGNFIPLPVPQIR